MSRYINFELSSLALSLQNSPYNKTEHLSDQKARLERALESEDISLVLDSCRSLLESICKTILNDRILDGFTSTTSFNELFKSTFKELFKNQSEENKKIQKACSGFIHQLGELRNSEGGASHGKDAFHIGNVTIEECELISRFSDAIAGFLLLKHSNDKHPSKIERIYYEDYPDFNDYFDGENSPVGISVGDVEFTELASKFLFQADKEAYKEATIQFMSHD